MIGSTTNIHPDLLLILSELEAHMGFDLTITSGHRSVEHNADPKVGGVKNSEHTYEPAQGVDILCRQSVTRYKMKKWLYANDVRRIGTGEDFVHIGIAEDKPQFVEWHYYPHEEE